MRQAHLFSSNAEKRGASDLNFIQIRGTSLLSIATKKMSLPHQLLEVDVWDTNRVQFSETLIVPEHNSPIFKSDLMAVIIPAGRHLRAHSPWWKLKMHALKLVRFALLSPYTTMLLYILPEQIIEIAL